MKIRVPLASDFVIQFTQQFRDSICVLALNLNDFTLDRSACSTKILELYQQLRQHLNIESSYDRDDFAFLSFPSRMGQWMDRMDGTMGRLGPGQSNIHLRPPAPPDQTFPYPLLEYVWVQCSPQQGGEEGEDGSPALTLLVPLPISLQVSEQWWRALVCHRTTA